MEMIIVGVIALIAIALFIFKKGKVEVVKKVILALVAEAEKKFGEGTGEIKHCYVVERIYEVLPWFIRALFNKKQIDSLIKAAVSYLENYLKEGKTL